MNTINHRSGGIVMLLALTILAFGAAFAAVEPIGSISGRLVDAEEGTPLSGDEPTFAFLILKHCTDTCQQTNYYAVPDQQGSFEFQGSPDGPTAGTYQVLAYVNGYQGGLSATFDVLPGEEADIGEFAITPDPLEVVGFSSCEAVPPGGTCAFSVTVRNRTRESFIGRSWATILSNDYTYFQVGAGGVTSPRPLQVRVQPGALRQLAFRFQVPGDWAALDKGEPACPVVEIGQAPFAMLNAVIYGVLVGCLVRDDIGFSMNSGREAIEAFRAARPGPASPSRRQPLTNVQAGPSMGGDS